MRIHTDVTTNDATTAQFMMFGLISLASHAPSRPEQACIRLADAERSVQSRATRGATESKRIATDKIEWTLASFMTSDRPSRMHSTRVSFRDTMRESLSWRRMTRRVIKPMRYQCRVAGKHASYDVKCPSTYNAGRDNPERSERRPGDTPFGSLPSIDGKRGLGPNRRLESDLDELPHTSWRRVAPNGPAATPEETGGWSKRCAWLVCKLDQLANRSDSQRLGKRVNGQGNNTCRQRPERER
ncbi:hypothetical protein OKW28_003991 [Paraburkholderia sp. 40]